MLGTGSNKTRLCACFSLLFTGCYQGVQSQDAGPDAGGATEGAGASDTAPDGSTEGDSDNGGPDAPIPEVGCDGLRPQRAPLRRLSDWQYRNTIADLFDGSVLPSDHFPPTSAAFRFSSEPDANLVTDLATEQLLIAAEDVGAQVLENVASIAPCGPGENGSQCAADFLEDFGPRAFRRPLRDDERALLLASYEDGASQHGYADGMGRLVTVALQLPAFLYLIEEGATTQGDTVRLTDYEVAARLSYLIWGTMPDAELRALADASELHESEQIADQTQRMLADPRATLALTQFHREWLEIRELRPADKDAEMFGGFGEEMIASFDEQLARFVSTTLQSDDPSLVRLLTSNEVDVDATLAPLFGIEAPADWTRVSADPERRSGILTLPAYLAAHASADRTSAVERGLVVRERVLCQELGTAPPEAMEPVQGVPENASEREKTEALIADARCGSCHIQMNPLGMGFEHYDAVGAWRESYEDGAPIDTAWDLLATPEGLEDAPFDGAVELTQLLAGSEPVAHCFVENWVHHGFGAPPGDDDVSTCAIEELSAEFMASEQSLPALIIAFTQTDGFRYRDVSQEE